MAVLFAVMAGLGVILSSNPPAPNPVTQIVQFAFFGAVSLASLLAAAWLTWWTLNARIEADARGLRWRGGVGWKSARWEEVQDYYDRLPVRAGRDSLRAVIRTTAGTVSFSRQWTQIEPLRVLVTRQATGATAHQWEILGSRPSDSWPRVFRYDTWQNVWTPRIVLKLVLTGFVYAFAKPLQQSAGLAGLVGWPTKLTLFAPYLLILLVYGGPLLLVFSQYHAAGRRRAERITANTDGIVFEDGARRVQAAWADVTGYGVVHGPGADHPLRRGDAAGRV